MEQVDRMMEECGSPRRSAGWKPHTTFAAEAAQDTLAIDQNEKAKAGPVSQSELVEQV